MWEMNIPFDRPQEGEGGSFSYIAPLKVIECSCTVIVFTDRFAISMYGVLKGNLLGKVSASGFLGSCCFSLHIYLFLCTILFVQGIEWYITRCRGSSG